ncbi:MAG: SPOR domain-containing protein [Acidobacteriaceae bacterium]
MTRFCEDDFDVPDPVEVRWSAKTILSIFFAASLISALFFGLGYSLGGATTSRRSVAVTSPGTNGGTGGISTDTAGSMTGTAALRTAADDVAAPRPAAAATSAPPNPIAQNSEATTPALPPQIHPAIVVPLTQPAIAIARAHSTPAANAATRTQIMVQVGAIGNRRDAERLVAELRKKGFRAGIYSGKRDKFLHVQIGPFKDAQHAQVKRHQVLASGFRAILKSAS